MLIVDHQKTVRCIKIQDEAKSNTGKSPLSLSCIVADWLAIMWVSDYITWGAEHNLYHIIPNKHTPPNKRTPIV